MLAVNFREVFGWMYLSRLMLYSQNRGFGTVCCAKFTDAGTDVMSGCGLADAELLGNFLIAQSFNDQC